MPRSLHRLVYCSRNRLGGTREERAVAVRGILAASRRNNPRVEVTGALMFNAALFAQVLEGPRAAVEATFERIQGDERHGDVTLLAFAPAGERGFPDWSMAQVGGGEAEREAFGDLAADSGFDPARLDADRLFILLRERLMEGAAA